MPFTTYEIDFIFKPFYIIIYSLDIKRIIYFILLNCNNTYISFMNLINYGRASYSNRRSIKKRFC